MQCVPTFANFCRYETDDLIFQSLFEVQSPSPSFKRGGLPGSRQYKKVIGTGGDKQ